MAWHLFRLRRASLESPKAKSAKSLFQHRVTMKKFVFSISFLILACGASVAQPKPVTTPSPQSPQRATLPQQQSANFDLATYGVSFNIEPRLIIMMAAQEAAGFETTPAGSETSVFRAQVRKDFANL